MFLSQINIDWLTLENESENYKQINKIAIEEKT